MAISFPLIRALLVPLLALTLLSAHAGADEAQDIAREIDRISTELDRNKDRLTNLKAEEREISEFQTQVWATWLAPWNRTLDAIEAQKRAINGAIGGQNTRAMYDHLHDLEAEQARLKTLDGQSVEGCGGSLTDMVALIDCYNRNHQRAQKLQADIAELEADRNRLFDRLRDQRRKQATAKADRDKALKAEQDRLAEEKKRYEEMLEQTDKVLLPNLDGGGPPRLLTVEEFIALINRLYHASGGSADLDSDDFRKSIEDLTRGLLAVSGKTRQRIKDHVAALDSQLSVISQQLGGSGPVDVGGFPDNCPPVNPDPSLQSTTTRYPANDPRTYLGCAYYTAHGSSPGQIKSQVRYVDGKETGVSAYFTLDGGHHLEEIHNIHPPEKAGSECKYISASALKSYRWVGDDGTIMAVHCEPDGSVGRCDYTAHDGRSRGCSADCSKDACADLRQRIGWSAME